MEAPSSREFHPAANIFPMDDENIDALAEDIEASGLLVPIELLDGKIIDGRRRWMACRMKDVEPEYVEVSPPDPVAYVLSLNLHRRHLTPSQKSMIAARAREMYDKEADRRRLLGQQSGGRGHKKENSVENLPPSLDSAKARDAAGKALGVSGKSVDFATKVLEHGTPELIAAVDAGRMAVSTAAVHCTESPDLQREIVEKKTAQRNYADSSKKLKREKEDDSEIDQAAREKSKAIRYANEAIDRLKRIPKNDCLRKRGFQIVTDWIRHNK
jgi:hypothetical protein